MAVLADENANALCQGPTDSQGTFCSEQAITYGTKLEQNDIYCTSDIFGSARSHTNALKTKKRSKCIAAVFLTTFMTSMGSIADTGTNINQGFEHFKKICLSTPFSFEKHLSAARKTGWPQNYNHENAIVSFKSVDQRFSVLLTGLKRKTECSVSIQSDGDWTSSAQAAVNKVAGLPGYGGLTEAKRRGETKMSYRSGSITLRKSKNGDRVVLALSSQK